MGSGRDCGQQQQIAAAAGAPDAATARITAANTAAKQLPPTPAHGMAGLRHHIQVCLHIPVSFARTGTLY